VGDSGRSTTASSGHNSVRYESRRLFSMLLWSRGRRAPVGGEGDGQATVFLDDRDCDYEDVEWR
jgi:hypothetical protein